MRFSGRLWVGALVALAVGLAGATKAVAGPNDLKDPAVLRLLNSGMDSLFNLDYEKAWADFEKVKQLRPDTPLGEIFESEYYWWRIFNSTGDYYALDYIDALKTTTSAFDDQFINTMQKALDAGDVYLKSHPNDAEAYFHLGMANALRSRLEAGRDHTLAVIKYVRKSHDYLERCLQLDPNLKDAYLGLGAYNYYVEEYGGIYKPLRYLIRLPAGNRQEGIRELWQAAALNDFVSAEAKFFLASIYLRDSQRNYPQAEKIVTELAERYPNNPIFRFALANCQKQQKKWNQARENFEKVANHPLTPQVGDLAQLTRKELDSLSSSGSK